MNKNGSLFAKVLWSGVLSYVKAIYHPAIPLSPIFHVQHLSSVGYCATRYSVPCWEIDFFPTVGYCDGLSMFQDMSGYIMMYIWCASYMLGFFLSTYDSLSGGNLYFIEEHLYYTFL